jgi:hypothetical protein
MFGGPLIPFCISSAILWLISLLLANGLGRAVVVACVMLLAVLFLLAAFAIT